MPVICRYWIREIMLKGCHRAKGSLQVLLAAMYISVDRWDMKKLFNNTRGNTHDGKQTNHHLAVGKCDFFSSGEKWILKSY